MPRSAQKRTPSHANDAPPIIGGAITTTIAARSVPTYLNGDKAVADLLGVTPRTVTNLVIRGELRQYKVAGIRGNRYLLDDVLALIGEAVR